MSELITIATTEGNITLDLDSDKAPKTVENFLTYVDSGFYGGTIFHRVIDNFMIQGGGYEEGMIEKETNTPIENEANNGLSNLAYTIAMARTSDPHSASAQFFINVVDNKFLDYKTSDIEGFGYCVFGKVTSGFEVIDKIKSTPTETAGFNADVPINDVVISSISREG